MDLLGYHVFPGRRRLHNDNGHRFARKPRALRKATQRGGWTGRISTPPCKTGSATHGTRRRRACGGGSLGILFFSGGADQRPSRSLRGGSWNNKPRRVRAANRNNNNPDNRNNNIGFRLARDN
ncbi:MAG TPA: hypothetical protein EYG10_04120 [Gammaproteobacteria bacterium]|nr:hypothetical protein [Gammaproteobacteria bacterium]